MLDRYRDKCRIDKQVGEQMPDRDFLEKLSHRTIDREMDLGSFKCNDAVDWFLREAAHDQHARRISSVVCWLLGSEVVGYVTCHSPICRPAAIERVEDEVRLSARASRAMSRGRDS